MANEYTPTQLAAHIRKVWAKEIGLIASEEQVAVPHFKKMDKLEGELAFRKFGTLTAQSLPNGTAGTGLTNSGNTETAVSMTPQTKYVMTVTNLNTIARCAFNPQEPLRKQIEASLYEQVDVAGTTLFSSLSVTAGGAGVNWSDALVREARRLLVTNGKSKVKFGRSDSNLVCVFHPYGLDDLDAIEAFYRADIRGDDENPLVNGALYKVRGIAWYESGNVVVDTACRNGLFIAGETFGISYNKEYGMKMEEYELAEKLIGWVDFGVVERFDELGVLVNTSPTP